MTIGSLFSGIGGLELGLERAGLGPVKWQVENDEYCRRVLAKHWPDVIRYDDVFNVGKHSLEQVDLVCGGFPCQPFSQAGKQLGTDDPRHLWPQFIRIVRQLKPRWVVAENVSGLMSVDAGRVFGGVVRDLAQSGYRVRWDCVPAAAVGAPHLRDRVFILADAKHQRQQRRPTTRVHDQRQLGNNTARRGPHALLHPGRQLLEGRQEGCAVVGDEPYWEHHPMPEPTIRRVAHGVPNRVDRLRALGNAVVPQVAEYIGRMIKNDGTGVLPVLPKDGVGG